MSRKASHDSSWELFLNHGVHRESRTIFIGWSPGADEDERAEITAETAQKVMQEVALLESDSTEAAITILMNSPGGDEMAGWAIYDVLANSPCPVVVKVAGNCMSIATLILQAGQQRLSYPNAAYMVHAGEEGQGMTHPISADRWNEFNRNWRRRYYEVLSERCGQSVKYWRRKCTFDLILTPEDALREGLIDRIIVGPKRLHPVESET